ncbi:hypothetical protein BC940DRAFT_289725 [Gongronella butleri]|nr:hypothetical protein BC940DRAFT_289725 [Gongronella butleri]
MPSTPLLRQKNKVYQKNVLHRGNVKETLKQENGFNLPVSYWVLGVLAFALVGGAILQFIDLIF